ncbi:MAG: hypothetical protein KA765_20090, partial [Thermoflexales bacterium]|nr:hypothetical protein [Thermoflexales bacterium]
MSTTAPAKPRHRVRNFAIWIAVMLIVILAVFEIGFRLFYKLIPLDVCAATPIIGNYYCQPYMQYDKPIKIAYRYVPGYKTEGMWDPADPRTANPGNETRLTGRSDAFLYKFQTDEQGFPNDEYNWRDQYDIVIAGDSFTIRTAPKTWIESLRELTGQSVLALGAPSWSTLNEVEAIKQFGLDKQPKTVIVAFFEGNDLFNTEQYLERQATGLSWKEFDFQNTPLTQQIIMPYMIAHWLNPRPVTTTVDTAIRYRYPVTASTEVGYVPLVLKDFHLLPLSADYDTIARSDEFAAIKKSLLELKGLCDQQGTRLILMLVPSKEHVYWSRIWDPIDVNNILERTVTVKLSEGDRGH